MAGEGRGAWGLQPENGFNASGAACHVGCSRARGCSQSRSATIRRLTLAAAAEHGRCCAAIVLGKYCARQWCSGVISMGRPDFYYAEAHQVNEASDTEN